MATLTATLDVANAYTGGSDMYSAGYLRISDWTITVEYEETGQRAP